MLACSSVGSTSDALLASDAGFNADAFGAASEEVVFVGAGDIGNCGGAAEDTAVLLDAIPGGVFTLGDNAYPNGSLSDFLDCYDPAWGRHRPRTRPTIGNHEYHVPHGGAYFAYFGEAAGDTFKGYYSYDAGKWHIVSLNSNCFGGTLQSDIDVAAVTSDFGGCGPDSPQVQWLRDDLATHTNACTLVMWHHPRFSSGVAHGSLPALAPIWQQLVDAGVDVVLSGHDHHYERFAPQLADGTRDDERGIREFVVGTGGTTLRPPTAIIANSEVVQGTTHGVLKLTLREGEYDWEFVGVPGEPEFSDMGTESCH